MSAAIPISNFAFRKLVFQMKSIADKRAEFRKLHESGCFAIPNPWDIGTAKYLQHLGFKAIATTSAGFAFSRGLADGSVKRDEMIGHIRELVEATDVPVNADFENGYADEPNWCAENARLCAETVKHSDRQSNRSHNEGCCFVRRATRECRRCLRPRGLGRIHSLGQRIDGAGDVRRIKERRVLR